MGMGGTPGLDRLDAEEPEKGIKRRKMARITNGGVSPSLTRPGCAT